MGPALPGASERKIVFMNGACMEPSGLLISIITPSLNRVGFIKTAIESVLNQDYTRFEHLIMDGGSTDGTLEVLKRFPHLNVVCQPDTGIYDAINKGIGLAHGEVIGLLNTDDFYAENIFGTVANQFSEHPEMDALVGQATILQEKSKDGWEILTTLPSVLPGELLFRATQGSPVFNAWFFRKRLFEEIGTFDARYKYVADRDFLIRMAFLARAYKNLDLLFYHYRMHAGSFTLSGQDSGEASYMFETRALAERYIREERLNADRARCFKTWHSQITAEQVVTAWRKKGIRRIFQYLSVGFRYNPSGWPGIFMGKVIERFAVFLKEYFNKNAV